MAGDDTQQHDRPERWICDGEPSARYPIWTRGNVGEVFPWPVTPGHVEPRRDPVRRARLARRAGALRRLRPRRVRAERTPRSSGASAATATSTRPSPGSSASARPGLTPEQMDYSLWGEMEGVPPYEPMPGDDDPSKTEAIQATLGWIFSAPELTDLEADQRKMAELRANRPDFDAMSDAELVGVVPQPRTRAAAAVRRAPLHHLLLHGAARRDPGRVHRDRRPDARDDPRRPGSAASTRRRRPTRSGRWAGMVRASASLTAAFDAGVDGLLERLRADRRRRRDGVPRGVRRLHLRVRVARARTSGRRARRRGRPIPSCRSPPSTGCGWPTTTRPRGATRRRWPRPARPPSPACSPPSRATRDARPAQRGAGRRAGVPRRPGAHQDQHHPPGERDAGRRATPSASAWSSAATTRSPPAARC